MRTAERTPGASEGEKTNKNENGQSQTEAPPSRSEHVEAKSLACEEHREKADDPILRKVRELAQPGAVTQVERDSGTHKIAETRPCPQELKSAMLMQNSSAGVRVSNAGVRSPIWSPNFGPNDGPHYWARWARRAPQSGPAN
ncbi:MAG: hypothetical protein WCD02_12935 [Terriglobales bacterium]